MKAHVNTKLLFRAIKIAAPVVGGQLGIVLMGTTDTIMCGKVSNIAQAAVGMGSAIYFLFVVFGMGLYQGITTLVSIADGAKETHKSGRYFKAGLLLLIPSTIIINFCIWLSAFSLSYIGLPEEIVVATKTYLDILLWGTPALLLFILCSAYLNGLSKTMPTMLATFVALIANYYFNDILIFGKLGLPAYGFEGSAYATNFSRVVLFAGLAIYIIFHRTIKSYLLKKSNLENRNSLKEVAQIGLPIGFQLFLEVFAFTASFIIAGWIGSIEVAVHQNVLNVASVTFMFITGISTASNIMIGNGYGAKNKTHIKDAALSCLYLIIITEVIFAALFIFAGKPILSWYNKDSEILILGAPLMIIAAAFQLSDGLQNLGLNMLRGIKDVKIPATIAFVCYWLIMIPLSYYLAIPLKMGLAGIWWGFVIGLSLASVLLLLRFHSQFKNLDKQW